MRTSRGENLNNIAVIGAGPVGSILSAYLTRSHKNVFLVEIQKALVEAVREQGITVGGKREPFTVRLSGASSSLSDIRRFKADLIALAVKMYHLEALLDEIPSILRPGQKILVVQNGIDNEERVAQRFGRESVLRAVINYAGMVIRPGLVHMTFFNPPNYIGILTPDNEPLAREFAATLTEAGLETVFTPEIKKYEWIKTILAAGLMPVCAVTGLNMKEAFENKETRFLCEQILRECLRVAESQGLDLEERFYEDCLFYLSQAGQHKPSSSVDLERGNPVEYVFQQIIDYGKKGGVPTPCLESLTMVIRTLEKRRQKKI